MRHFGLISRWTALDTDMPPGPRGALPKQQPRATNNHEQSCSHNNQRIQRGVVAHWDSLSTSGERELGARWFAFVCFMSPFVIFGLSILVVRILGGA